MSDMFDQFDNEFDTQALAQDVASAQANSGKYEEPPCNTYEVKITYIGIGKTKAEKPMAKVTYEIVAAEDETLIGRRIYQNQVLTAGFQIHIFNEFLRSLKTSIPVTFTTFREYNRTMIDIKAECDERKLTFSLNFSKDKKNYNVFTIEQVFENAPAPVSTSSTGGMEWPTPVSAPTQHHFEPNDEERCPF